MPRTKDNVRNVRNTEARKRLAGLREIRVWVPDDVEAIAGIRGAARRLCELTAAKKAPADPS